MALDYRSLKAHAFAPERQAYGEDDCILYALGVGAGLAADDPVGDETRFIYEQGLSALPAMACVLAYPGFWMRDPRHGLDWSRVVHGEQRMRFPRRLPPHGEVLCQMEVARIADKGPGAFVVTRRTLCNAATGQEFAVIEQLNICRGDGGYSGGDAALSDALAAPIPAPPATPPDSIIVLPTSRNQGALYRLNADRNPLHVDPASGWASWTCASWRRSIPAWTWRCRYGASQMKWPWPATRPAPCAPRAARPGPRRNNERQDLRKRGRSAARHRIRRRDLRRRLRRLGHSRASAGRPAGQARRG
jgi:acyl dehydratase